MKYIKCEKLSKMFKQYKVLENIDCSFYNDKVNFIIGANGTGKSTLISCILEFLSYEGVIVRNFEKIVYQPEKMVLPDFIKVKDYLKVIQKIDRSSKNFEDLLIKFNLVEAIDKDLYTLSKGMKQKILLIQTLLRDSDAYIFDEPLSGLDINTQKVFFEEVEQLLKQDKMVIIITHFLEQYPIDDYYLLNLNDKVRYNSD